MIARTPLKVTSALPSYSSSVSALTLAIKSDNVTLIFGAEEVKPVGVVGPLSVPFDGASPVSDVRKLRSAGALFFWRLGLNLPARSEGLCGRVKRL